MMAYAVHLMAIVVNPSEAPEINDSICNTLDDNAVHPSDAPDMHDGICSTLVGKCSTPK